MREKRLKWLEEFKAEFVPTLEPANEILAGLASLAHVGVRFTLMTPIENREKRQAFWELLDECQGGTNPYEVVYQGKILSKGRNLHAVKFQCLASADEYGFDLR